MFMQTQWFALSETSNLWLLIMFYVLLLNYFYSILFHFLLLEASRPVKTSSDFFFWNSLQSEGEITQRRFYVDQQIIFLNIAHNAIIEYKPFAK